MHQKKIDERHGSLRKLITKSGDLLNAPKENAMYSFIHLFLSPKNFLE